MIYRFQNIWYTHAANQGKRKTLPGNIKWRIFIMKLFNLKKHIAKKEEIRRDTQVRCYACVNGIIIPVL